MNVSIPWGNWYGNHEKVLSFPDDWDVTDCSIKLRPSLSETEILNKLENPINSKRVSDLVRGKKSICIIIDDISRPTRGGQILPIILELLRQGGIHEDNVEILLALGGHRHMTQQDIIKKVGPDIMGRVSVINHNPFAKDLAVLADENGNAVEVNRHFAEADIRIAVGCIVPHTLAGFSGGAKAVIPGIGGIDTLNKNHNLVYSGTRDRSFSNNTLNPDNPMRLDMERITGICGLDFIVNIVMNRKMEIAALFAGHYIDAHRSACKAALEYYRTKLVNDADVLILNTYPKDTEYSQIGTAFSVLGHYKEYCIKPGGTIVLTTAASEGGGYHALFGPGMSLFSPHDDNVPPPELRDREVFIYSPELFQKDMEQFYVKKPPLLLHSWDEVIKKLAFKHGKPKTAVYPMGSMQIGYCDDKY
jgi:nickel-dependent lactate racemase